MSNFPKLIPAFTVQIHLGTPSPIGTLAHGPSQLHAPFLPDAGALVSEPDYPLRIDAVFLHGSDFLRFDPDGNTARLEVASALRDRATGAVIRFDYTGTIDISGAAGKVLKDLPGAATTEFGDACGFCCWCAGRVELTGSRSHFRKVRVRARGVEGAAEQDLRRVRTVRA
ncbi:hypothetical protein N0V92_010341 [Colletotrichum tropicale]|nr:hypothetical protein N0V92_010341 [Colletotrichum tropicale]